MKWVLALVLASVVSAQAGTLTLQQEGDHVLGPQSTSNPCVIAATTCQQDTNIFGYTNYTQNGSQTSLDELSPIYTVSQFNDLAFLAFSIAIDVNTTREAGETLQYFGVLINGVVTDDYLGPHLIGDISNNGNGYADWSLRSIDLTGRAFTDTVQFHAVWNGASDGGESFFLTQSPASVPGPILGAGLPGLVMACGGLTALALRRRAV